MTSSAAILVLGLLAAANAAPWPSDIPKCARECPTAGSPKLAYAPEKTYSYAYSGRSEIHMKDVQGGVTQMEWTSQVDLTWLSPCDMAITFKNPSFGGASGTPEANFLTRYPMVVAMTDGRVQHVCSHPDDDTWSINLKKGVASAFQNSLPSNSSVNSGLNFTETDVSGKGPTKYTVENQGEKVIVEKEKNHRFCQERFPTQAETPMSWLKAPLPMQESRYKCKQEITKGIYTLITCEDKSVIKPAIGSYKYVVAKTMSKLQFKSESESVPTPIANLRGQLVHRSIRYDHETLKKDPAMVPQLEQVWKQVCEKTKDGIEKEAASLVDKAIDLMRRVPEEAIDQMLQKVKSGQICAEHQLMESLFLDAVAFVQEASAVKLIVREILSSETSGGRAALYTAALYFTPRPSLRAVEALKPLFEQSKRFPMASLAAASMVNTYCRHHPHCQEEAPVRQVAEILSRNIQQQCSPSAGEDSEKGCLASLKSLGNMGVMTSEVARTVINCIEMDGAEKHICVAAAQAFRNVKCDREPTRHLIRIAVDPKKDTEIRIASYLAAVKCAEEEDLEKVSNKISSEENTQVRGFILSHLLNLQKSSASHKEKLQYILSSISVPTNFSADVRKYSRNIDLSYYAPSLGIGAGVESNIIYAPRSFIPRSMNLNLTSAMGATPVNLGEFGARVEGLEPMLENLFGPEGYFQKSSMNKIFRDISEYAKQEGTDIFEHLQNSIRQRRSIDLATISHFFNKIYGEYQTKQPRADFFARFDGQEVAYASLTKASMQNINVNRLMDTFLDLIEDVLQKMKQMNVHTTRTLQLALDYSLPTIQGIPLKMKLDGTAVVGLKMESRLNSFESSSPSMMKIIPSISAEVQGFIGFNAFISSCGVRTKNRISSNNGVSVNIKGGREFELELDIPEKIEMLDIKSETYLMKAVKGQPDTKISPPGVRQSQVQHQNCFHTLEQKIGLKVCYDLSMPDILRSDGLPLGPPAFAKITVEKSEPSMTGFRVKGAMQKSPSKKEMKIQMETPGSSMPRRAEVLLTSSTQQENCKMAVAMSSQTSAGIKMELRTKNSESEKELGFNAYYSQNQQFSPESQVMEAKVSTRYNGQETQVQILTQTKNALKSFMDLHFDVRGDLEYNHRTGLTYPRRLEYFELRTVVDNFRFISSVQKRSESEYSSIIKIGSRSNDRYSLEAKHNLEGSWDQGITMKTLIAAKMGHEQFKAASYIYNTHEKIGASLQIVRPQETSKVIEWEAVMESTGQAHKTKFQLDIPEYMRAIKFDSNVEEQDGHRYQLRAALKHGLETVLQVDGPIRVMSTYSMKQLQTDVRIQTLASTLYRISSTLLWADKKQILAFEMKEQEVPLIAFEWNMSSENEEQTKAGFKFLLPSVIDSKTDAVISNKNIQINFNNVVLPKNSSPQRVKGSTDVDFENKKVQAELYWDADQDPNKKLHVEATFVRSSPSSQETLIHGGWSFAGSPYQYKVELRQSDAETWLYGRKNIKLQINTPSQKTYNLETTLDVEHQPSGAKIDAKMTYKNPQNKVYELNGIMALEKLGGPFGFKFNSKTNMISPEGQPMSLIFEAKHEKSPSQREAYMQMQIESPSLSKPLQTSFTLMHQPSSYKAEWKIDVQSSANGGKYELMLSPEGGVQSFKVGLNMKEIVDLLKAVQKLTSKRSGSESPREQATYLILYEKPNHTSHKILIHSPSRKMEGEVKYSPSEFAVKFYPHSDRTESKYELSVSHSKISSPGKEGVKLEGRFDHPSLERHRMIELMYTKNEEKIQGTVTLDIFPMSEDKITGTLESVKIARNSVMAEVNLSGRVLKVNPRVTVTAAYAPHTAGIDILFEKTPTSRPSFILSGKYDVTSGRNAAVALVMKTESGPVLEISGSLNPEQQPECNGLKISAVAHSSVLGSYDVFSKLCEPAYMEINTRKHGSDKSYIFKVGLQTMRNIELSTLEKDERTQEKTHISLAKVKLISPTLVSVEMKCKSTEASNLLNSLLDNWSRILSAAESWMGSMHQEVMKEEGSASISEMAKLWQEAKEQARGIYESLFYDIMIPSFQVAQRVRESQFVKSLISGYKILWSQVEHFRKELVSYIQTLVKPTKYIFGPEYNFFDDVVGGSAYWLQTGEVSEATTRLADQLQDLSVWSGSKRIIEALFIRFPDEYDALKKIVEKLKDDIARNAENTRVNLLAHYLTDADKLWIWRHLALGGPVFLKLEQVIDNVIQESLLSAVKINHSHIQLQIPLRQPANSLTEAGQYMAFNLIPVPQYILSLYEGLMMPIADFWLKPSNSRLHKGIYHLLPPFNRTAMVVDGSEILTFDGVVLRAPRSPCKVLLAAYKSHSLIMEHPQSSSSPQVTLKSTGVTVVIKPDHKVTVNGREVSGQEMTEGQVKVWKTSAEIKVLSPFMIVRVFPRNNVISVEVSGWTFGWVAGLLGTYDGEMTNDWATSQGSKASSLQELVRSWQEDQQCQTPSISSMSASQTPALRSLQCQALLGIRSRCTPVVRPEPFIKMCHSSRSACDVARAYNAICSSKGVKDVFPLTC